MGTTQIIGKQAEDLACEYLHRQGLRLLQRNYTTRYGEIDLVMRDHDTTVFVEVRYRSRDDYVDALTSIDTHKQRKLIRTAQHYLQRQRGNPLQAARIDVIAISALGSETQIHWIKNAIEA